MDLSKYGYLVSAEDRPLPKVDIEKILSKYELKLGFSNKAVDEALLDLVGDFPIPNGYFRKKEFYTDIDATDAISIRKHILVTNLISVENLETYTVLLPTWSSTFRDLVYISKNL